MKKIMSGILVAGTLLMTATPAFAAEAGSVGSEPDTKKIGDTTLTITDYTVDPETKLPTNPGKFTLVEVPNIDFGTHSLDSIDDTGHVFVEGTYSGDLQVTDTRPDAASITNAKDAIAKVPEGTTGKTDSQTAWDDAIAAGAWRIDAKATMLSVGADAATEIGTNMTVNGVEVLAGESFGTVVTETATKPVGTASYLNQLKGLAADGTGTEVKPTLTIANNQLKVDKYAGTINYQAVAAE